MDGKWLQMVGKWLIICWWHENHWLLLSLDVTQFLQDHRWIMLTHTRGHGTKLEYQWTHCSFLVFIPFCGWNDFERSAISTAMDQKPTLVNPPTIRSQDLNGFHTSNPTQGQHTGAPHHRTTPSPRPHSHCGHWPLGPCSLPRWRIRKIQPWKSPGFWTSLEFEFFKSCVSFSNRSHGCLGRH